ncbi:Uncharacterised protein [Vibrio cholerae]|nr:Uncharacterised protein [Vibrio cholerae]
MLTFTYTVLVAPDVQGKKVLLFHWLKRTTSR